MVNRLWGTVRRPVGLGDMPNRTFAPIWIRDGSALGQRSIESLNEVIAFLESWPDARGDAFRTVLDICRMAATGHATVLQARQAFWQFAADAKILAEVGID